MKPRLRLIRLAAGLITGSSIAISGMAAASIEPAPDILVSHQASPMPIRFHRSVAGESFFLASDVNICLGSNTNASLTDLKLGEIAHVSYTIENGRWLAYEIVVTPSHRSRAASRSSTGTNELHAHGKILAYNATTGNLTIKYHR